ncbi:UNVERIFIED_CONTAM: Pentatricopeptide repeat-containing protein [Sesamum latifolium]|uniref:Pentatricopeptide repeat-containing protein n=1 Tax=Sesamum latifolium TaxID=2727402 RepID=A0AAW2VU39_9LAMI
MRLSKIQLWRHVPNSRIRASFLSHFSTKPGINTSSPLPAIPGGAEAAHNSDIETISVTDATHWSRRIHKLCIVDRDADAALGLLHQLCLRGFRPDSLNISSILHALCDANRFAEAHHRFLLFISSHSAPDERTCNVLIARLLDGRDPYSTLRLINTLVAEKPEFVPSLVNYNRLVDGFCKLGRLDAAHLMLYHMMKRGHCPNVVSYTTLINGYCRIGDVGAAEKVFDEMSEYGVRSNAFTYSTLFRGFLRKREFENGKKIMRKVWEAMGREEDVQVNSAAFCSVIDSLCREGLFHEVFKIAEDMPQGKNVLEEFAYGQMIDSLCRFERYNAAARIVYMMRKRDFIPSLVSYNSIIHGLCKDGDILRAYQLLEEGMQFGYSPSEFTYTVLVEGLCREYDLAKAKEVLNVMLSREGVDRTRMYNIYLRALCHMNNPTELLNVLVLMFQSQCQPDIISLNTVIKGFCKMGRVEEALHVFDDMIMGKFCAPDEVTYGTIIPGLLNVGKAEKAVNFLRNVMPEKGFSPGVVTYNARVPADCITYTAVIEGLCESKCIDDAKKFWNNVVWPTGVHDNFVYAALLKGLCHLDKFNEACNLLYELADCGVTLNNVNYNIVLDYACELGLKREAYQIVGEMRKNGVVPDAVTWRILDKLHHNLGQPESGGSTAQSVGLKVVLSLKNVECSVLLAFICVPFHFISDAFIPVSRHRRPMNLFDRSLVVDKDAYVARSASVIGYGGCSGVMMIIHMDEDEAFVGMGATLLDGVVVEKTAMVAAGALVRQNTRIPFGEVHAAENANYFDEMEFENVLLKKFPCPDEDYDSMLGINRETPPRMVLPDNIILPDKAQKAVQ